MKLKLFTVVMLMAMAQTAYAGGCFPGDPCYDAPVIRRQVVPATPAPTRTITPTRSIAPAVAPAPVAPKRVAAVATGCNDGWSSDVGVGVPTYLFQEEDNDAGGGLYANFTRCNMNLRAGAEVTHTDLNQPNALPSAEFPGKEVDITYVRVPLSVEYVMPVAQNTRVFLGGGPDLIATANDISDFSVGMHLGARVAHDITENVGLALEAGYMWGEIDDNAGDIDLDGTYITPSVYYRF